MKSSSQRILLAAQKNLANRSELVVDGETFQVGKIYVQDQSTKRTAELVSYGWHIELNEEVIGDDYNGNFYTIRKDGSVCFLDHETGNRKTLAPSVKEFVNALKEPEDVELPDHEVISVWVKPGFKPEFD